MKIITPAYDYHMYLSLYLPGAVVRKDLSCVLAYFP